MGLFSKREACPYCGGKVKGLFPWKIEGHCVCSDCYGMVDLPAGAVDDMTLEDFAAYRTFRDENAQLKNEFQISDQIDFGLLDTKFLFDEKDRLLCMDKHLNATIFQGDEITSFTIKEDASLLFEGTKDGLKRYASAVPRIAREMIPMINQRIVQMEEFRRRERDYRLRGDESAPKPEKPYLDMPEPFKAFNVEIRFKHPYWSVFTADMSGPTFDNDRPDVGDYLREYDNRVETIEKLAQNLMRVAFPGAPEMQVSEFGGIIVTQTTAPAAAAASGDVVKEIQRFKELVDQGLLTPEEFAAKKKQLLGI